MPVAGTRGRLRRLELRASPELKAAIGAGLVSSRKGDEMIYWPKARQDAYIAACRARVERSHAVAETIRAYLDGLDGRRPDLEALRAALARREAREVSGRYPDTRKAANAPGSTYSDAATG